jgi:hypothetical protein
MASIFRLTLLLLFLQFLVITCFMVGAIRLESGAVRSLVRAVRAVYAVKQAH